ncbi:MAG: respiratory nitrate reductase subunit gamma [Deltaproteobacteria bacterium]|nr:respiratory nitrate reductase subunit gamma [Deltaproteobacteria bacterium]
MDKFLFVYLPYVVITVAIVGTIWRFVTNRYSWSSQSSQFLENGTLFWGSIPWHIGIVLVLLMHIIAIVIPSFIPWWNASPVRLAILEISGLALGFLAGIGIIVFVIRRLSDSRVRAVTSNWDVIVLIVLLIQVGTGILNAIMYKWGSNWYSAAAGPWVRSIIFFSPNELYVSNLPPIVKIHIVNALVFIFLIPFTRFVHFLALIGPFQYIFGGRPYQLVRWYGYRTPRTEPIRQYK